jgi:hypothetical protein
MPAPEFATFSRTVTLHGCDFTITCDPGWKTSLALYPADAADPDALGPVALVAGLASCSYARIGDVTTYSFAETNYDSAEALVYGWAAIVADYEPVLSYAAAEEEKRAKAAADTVAAQAEADAQPKKKGKGKKAATTTADASDTTETPADGADTETPTPADPSALEG